MLIRIIFVLFSLFLSLGSLSAAGNTDNNVREVNISDSGHSNDELNSFIGPLRSFFFSDSGSGSEGILGAFTTIAFQIKNFFIGVAILFLIVGVLKLLFSSSDEENVKKWRNNIIWTSVGIFVMQIAFSVWNTLILRSDSDIIGSSFGWDFWINIFAPIVNLLQMLAAFGFLFMAVWAFFMLVTAGGDEEKSKKAKNTILYAIVGFLLIRIPYAIVKAFYGRPGCENSGGGFITLGTCDIKSVDLSSGIGIIGKIFTYFNTFLSVICVILIVYAGWLVLISGGEEEKLKKAKNTILYIVIGFVILVASHAIFRFFILKG
ncbi:hypothetical protein K2X92_04175 [Candidatus Gracilibacteria bacterium]|nr:hypothetical protein [Candidatus Gracilibacteria bacterium]